MLKRASAVSKKWHVNQLISCEQSVIYTTFIVSVKLYTCAELIDVSAAAYETIASYKKRCRGRSHCTHARGKVAVKGACRRYIASDLTRFPSDL